MKFPNYFRRIYSISADAEYSARIIGMLISADIPFDTVNEIGGKISFCVHAKSLNGISAVFSRLGIEYSSAPRGFHAHILRHRARIGIAVGTAIFTVACIVSSQYIWDIDIPYSEAVPQNEIESILSDAGLYIGAKKSDIDEIKIASEAILKSDKISWLSVNLKGTVAHIEYRTSEAVPTVDITSPSNLVSLYDGQIVSIALDGGIPKVKCGQIVKKGQILASGIIDSAALGCRLVRSRGSVKATVEKTFFVYVPLSDEVKMPSEQLTESVNIKIFKKNLKVFASIDNLPEKYDTIEINKRITLFGIRLPISVCTVYAVPYTVQTIMLTEDEAYAKAQSEMQKQLYATLGDAEIISASETVSIDKDMLTLTTVVDCVCEIASEVKINTEK